MNASIVSGLAQAPTPNAKAPMTAVLVARVRSQSSRQANATIQQHTVVDCAKYDARYSSALGPVAQSSQTTTAGQTPRKRLAITNTSAPLRTQSATGIAPGSPTQAPGAMSSECAGQYLLATTGVLKT